MCGVIVVKIEPQCFSNLQTVSFRRHSTAKVYTDTYTHTRRRKETRQKKRPVKPLPRETEGGAPRTAGSHPSTQQSRVRRVGTRNLPSATNAVYFFEAVPTVDLPRLDPPMWPLSPNTRSVDRQTSRHLDLFVSFRKPGARFLRGPPPLRCPGPPFPRLFLSRARRSASPAPSSLHLSPRCHPRRGKKPRKKEARRTRRRRRRRGDSPSSLFLPLSLSSSISLFDALPEALRPHVLLVLPKRDCNRSVLIRFPPSPIPTLVLVI